VNSSLLCVFAQKRYVYVRLYKSNSDSETEVAELRLRQYTSAVAPVATAINGRDSLLVSFR
jgi:hypothetical protein